MVPIVLAIGAIYASSIFLGLLPSAPLQAMNQPRVSSIGLKCADILFIGVGGYTAWQVHGPYVVYVICSKAVNTLSLHVIQWPLFQTGWDLSVAATLGCVVCMVSLLVRKAPNTRVEAQLVVFVVVLVYHQGPQTLQDSPGPPCPLPLSLPPAPL